MLVLAGPRAILVADELSPRDFDKKTAAKESRAAVERFVKEWNTGDNDKLRKALHFPFVTVGRNGEMNVSNTPGDFKVDFARLRTRQNWDHSTFDEIEPIIIADDNAHYRVAWSRHNTAGRRYMTGEAVCSVTKKNGHWAFAVRSSIWYRRKIQPEG